MPRSEKVQYETQTSRPQQTDLLIIDDILPSDFSPFRTLEYSHYLSFFDSALLSLEGWHLWVANDSFAELAESSPLAAAHPERVLRFEDGADIAARLAYVTFLGNAQRLLPYFKARSLPFILQLYPGGGFEVNQDATDKSLREVLLCDLCRGVIVTQTLTRDYIQDKIGVDPAKVTMVFGGVFDSRVNFDFSRDKLFYPTAKDTLDLCFVAHKYAGDLSSKGYDQFVAIALALTPELPNLRFHVVGDYGPEDIPLGAAENRFTFYGRRPSEFFAHFYPRMDAIVSVNKPFVLAPGAFDGFPTGSCLEAGFRGVLNCINDPLDLNPTFIDGQDIVLLDYDTQRSITMLRDLLADPSRLYKLAYANWRKFLEIFAVDAQLWARSRVISAELARQPRLISFVPAGAMQLDAALSQAEAQAQIAKLVAGSNELQSTYLQLESSYRGLEDHYRTLESNYRSLQEQYTTLVNSHCGLEEHYHTLVSSHRGLADHFVALENSYRAVETEYRSLQSHYLALEAAPLRHAARLHYRPWRQRIARR
jgi:glycosyltransferase involved in cell wall biosynthesis